MRSRHNNQLYTHVRKLLQSARSHLARSVNSTQVVVNWLIGREIILQEQQGKWRAEYGQQVLQDLSARLCKDFGGGYSVDNLELFRRFYLAYPTLVSPSPQSQAIASPISDAARRKLPPTTSTRTPQPASLRKNVPRYPEPGTLEPVWISDAPPRKSWKPGLLNPELSWTHYRALLRVQDAQPQAFYEIEAIKNSWSARELQRQINSLLYERLAMSKDKRKLLRMATKGQEIKTPADLFKDPVIMEFVGLPDSPHLVESDLERSLIANLRAFLLEMGKGFAFVARQERITLDGDHFYIDLVFYHTILKCYILIDLKVGKLTHQDLGQLQLYVNYYDRRRRTTGDNPTLGLILCTDKNDAVIKYTLGEGQSRTIFASRYKLHIPSMAALRKEIRRELRMFQKPEVHS